jgi:hypothetical protein
MTKDKLYHLIAGFAISISIGLFSPILGLAVAVLAGIAKDVVYDLLLKKGTFELLDILATTVGAVIGAIVTTTINL